MNEEKLSLEEKRFLLALARATITARLENRSAPTPSREERAKVGSKIEEPRGCFVTLHKKGNLRGCIGTFFSDTPLWQNVKDMAIQSAFYDPRFPPLAKSELKDIDIEISALSPLREIKSVDEIKVGEHGIYITKGHNRGVLLPQVATENGWDLETFLEHTCLKAGLPPKAWKEPGVTIEIFSAEVFGEKDTLQGCQ